MVSKAQRSFRSGFLVLKDILERAGSIGYTINIPACVENVLVDLGGPQVSGPVSRGNLQKRENYEVHNRKKNLKYFLQKFYILNFYVRNWNFRREKFK